MAAAGLCSISLASAQNTTDAATAERMERAKRDAANPLRIIIEAAQVKRTKAVETTTPAPTPAAAVIARPPAAAAPAPAVAAQARPSRSDTATAGAAPLTRPSTAATPAPAPAPAPTPTAVAEPVPEPAIAAAPASAVPTPAPEASAAAAPAQLAAATPRAAPPAPVPDALAPLKLVRYIEPEIPSRIRSRLKPNNEVTVVLKVNPDGSVSGADIRATTSRALDAVVLDAVKQWRYDPVPEAREHTVQLVFNLSE